jgi:hypothetical protein
MANAVTKSPPAPPPREEPVLPPVPDQLPKEVQGEGVTVSRRESLLLFFASALGFGLLGYHMIADNHVIVFDALDRLTRAYLVWHNDPPKLAAIGFLFPPFTSLVYLPLAAIKPVATSLIALSVTTAIFAAGTLTLLNRILARCEMPTLLRLVIVLAVAVNPMFLFYAGNGMSEAVYLFFLVFGLYCFISWYRTREARFLIGAGIGFSIALLTRYQFLAWALLVAILIGVGLVGSRRSRDEVEGSVIAYAAPVMYGITLWILFNTVIVGDPFRWLTDLTSGLAVNANGLSARGPVGFEGISRRTLELVVSVAPLALLVLPALLATFLMQRDEMALWLTSFLALAVVMTAANAWIQQDEGLLNLRDGLPIMLTAVICAGWMYTSLEPFRPLIWGATVLLLVIGIVTCWTQMQSYPFQNLEQSFVRALRTNKSQEGRNSVGGFQVGINPERRMAAYINRYVKRRNSILTDNAQTFGVMLLSGRPQLFFDRIDKGDKVWRQTLRAPWGKINYFLVATQAAGDLIRRAYGANALSGSNPALVPVFRTDRYTLLSVAPQPSATGVAPSAAATP